MQTKKSPVCVQESHLKLLGSVQHPSQPADRTMVHLAVAALYQEPSLSACVGKRGGDKMIDAIFFIITALLEIQCLCKNWFILFSDFSFECSSLFCHRKL